MTIKTATSYTNEQLHTCIINSLETICQCPVAIMAKSLPYKGSHLLVKDDNNVPYLIIYDKGNADNALLAAFTIADKMEKDILWLNRLYPSLFPQNSERQSINELLQIIILGPGLPSGLSLLKNSGIKLSCCDIDLVERNENIDLFIKKTISLDKKDDSLGNLELTSEHPSSFRNIHENLSTEELKYFENN